MNLGGYVWEDGVANKESLADGVNNTTGEGIDKPLKNIKVTLYEDDYNPDSNSGTIAELAEGVSEDPSHCINPVSYTHLIYHITLGKNMELCFK